jgi:hypothetical protein
MMKNTTIFKSCQSLSFKKFGAALAASLKKGRRPRHRPRCFWIAVITPRPRELREDERASRPLT